MKHFVFCSEARCAGKITRGVVEIYTCRSRHGSEQLSTRSLALRERRNAGCSFHVFFVCFCFICGPLHSLRIERAQSVRSTWYSIYSGIQCLLKDLSDWSSYSFTGVGCARKHETACQGLVGYTVTPRKALSRGGLRHLAGFCVQESIQKHRKSFCCARASMAASNVLS